MPAGPSILVVDDELNIRTTVSAILIDAGYTVTTATDGMVAINMLRAQPARYGLVLLDLMMPRMDGWTFRHQQLADATIASIPVIVMSANVYVRRGGFPSGLSANAYIHKPFGVDALLAVVGRFVRPAAS